MCPCRTWHAMTITLVVVIALSALSGCMADDGPADENSTDRRGWTPKVAQPKEASAVVPSSVGIFLESGATAGILESCGLLQARQAVLDDVAAGLEWQALDTVLVGCAHSAADARKDETVAEARSQGNERDVKEKLVAVALASLARAERALSESPGPADAVEAAFIERLQRWFVQVDHDVRSIDDWWIPYEQGYARTAFQLGNVYGLLIAAEAYGQTIVLILDAFPWRGIVCPAPDMAMLLEAVDTYLSESHAIGLEVQENADEANTWYEQINGSLMQRRNTYLENNWGIGMLALVEEARVVWVYWHLVADEASWLNMSEAIDMYQYVLGNTSSMWVKRELARIDWGQFTNVQRGDERWFDDVEEGAPAVTARLQVKDPFIGISCGGHA